MIDFEPPLGKHLMSTVVADFEKLNDKSLILESMIFAANKGGATIIHSYAHKFSPQGVTAFLLLAESHFAFHSWPEKETACLDLFTCGDTANCYEIHSTFLRCINARKRTWHVAPRIG